jgi:hypothetical protein
MCGSPLDEHVISPLHDAMPLHVFQLHDGVGAGVGGMSIQPRCPARGCTCPAGHGKQVLHPVVSAALHTL